MSVVLEPSHQLSFHRPFTRLVKEILIIRNPGPEPVAFKVKTTVPKQYCVRPNSGRIEVNGSVTVQVILQPMKEDPPPDFKCKDKFKVQSVAITAERKTLSLQEMWRIVEKQDEKAIKENKIECVYLPPLKPSSSSCESPSQMVELQSKVTQVVNEESNPPLLPRENGRSPDANEGNSSYENISSFFLETKNTKIIWVKFNGNPVKILFSSEDVFDLIEEAKPKLDGLDNFKMDSIEVYKPYSEEPLKFGQIVDDSFINQYETPIEIKAKRKGDHHDMIIKVGDDVSGHEFKVHSQILGARSIYFRSALLDNQCTKKDGRFYFVKPNITFEAFQIILRFIYGGTVSLDEQDTSDTLKVLAAADELLLQELVDYLQTYLIENKTEWIEQHFELTQQISFNSNSLLKLQKHCTDFMSKSPEKIFKSFDLSSLPEKSLISLIKRDDLQMKEIEIWEYVIKWGLEKNPTLIPDPTMWSDNDFKIMKNTLEHCLPLIRFFSISSEGFLQKVRPYKKLLNPQLYEDLIKSYLDPNSEPDEYIILPRYKNIDGIIDSKLVNLNIISIISIWIDKIDINSRFAYTRELYLPYKFKLLLRGSRDGFTPEKFHTLCDKIPYTVTFIKVKGTEEILGGYNPLRWESYGHTKDSFIFSFKNFRDSILSHVKNANKALFYCGNCGPSFDSDLKICVSGNDSSRDYDINVCRQQSYEKKIRETEENFIIEDYEVFHIMEKE